mgnify:FL=1
MLLAALADAAYSAPIDKEHPMTHRLAAQAARLALAVMMTVATLSGIHAIAQHETDASSAAVMAVTAGHDRA